jgi:membrane carboxypeptidase/penicillin-binding protein
VKAVIRRVALGLVFAFRPWSREMRRIVRELRTIVVPTLSINLTNALIEGEDHRFRMHAGVDLWAVTRALLNTFWVGRRQGASTIQQQLVRVATGRYEITLRRKIREMALGIALGRYFSQDEILALYLVKGYYGYEMSGLIRGCERLCISPAMASPAEAASLVARLKYPEPRVNSPTQRERIFRRTQHILARMTRAECQGQIGGRSRERELLRIAPGS